MPRISTIGTKVADYLKKLSIKPPKAQLLRPVLVSGPYNFFPPIIMMEGKNSSSSQKPNPTIKEDLLIFYKNKSASEIELKLLEKSLELASELKVDLTSKIDGIELLLSWNISIPALCAFVLNSSDPKLIREKLDENVAEIIQRLSNLDRFTYISDPYAKTGGKFLNMLILREENHEILLLKTAELFQSLLENVGGVHPKATLALECFSPLLKILGLQFHAQQLEDLAFLNSKPEEFKLTESQTFDQWQGGKNFLLGELKALADSLAEEIKQKFPELSPRISWRVKGLHSIYTKSRAVNDLLGIRLVVKSDYDCYTMRSFVTAVLEELGFKRIKNLSDDYIKKPKKSGYQALHEVYEEDNGLRIEIQIRSERMDYEAEVGHYSHLHYKLSKFGFDNFVLDGSDAQEKYLNNRAQLNTQRFFFAFDADGKIHKVGPVIYLGVKPTVLDFAFHLGRNLGSRCKGAKIRRLSPEGQWEEIRASFSTPIENGDMIELEISSAPLKISTERMKAATTELSIASLELLKQGREVDLYKRSDELKGEGQKIFEETISNWEKEIINKFNQIFPNPNLEKRFLYSIERVHKKLGFEDLGIFYTAIGLKRDKKEKFLGEIMNIVRSSSLVVGYSPEEIRKKETTLYFLVNNLPGILLRILQFLQHYSLSINSFAVSPYPSKVSFSLVTIRVKFNDINHFQSFLNKLSDLYKHSQLVSLLPLTKKVKFEIKTTEKELINVLNIILNGKGNIVECVGEPGFLSKKMKLEFTVDFPLVTADKDIEKITNTLMARGIKIRIINKG